MSTLDRRPHFLKANLIWLSPGIKGNAFLEQVTKDWQIASVVTASSGGAYTPGYSYNTAGSNVNITGSPDWGGRVVLGNNLGSGCSEQPVPAVQRRGHNRADLRQLKHGVGPQLSALLSEQERRSFGHPKDQLRQDLHRDSPARVPRGHIQRAQYRGHQRCEHHRDLQHPDGNGPAKQSVHYDGNINPARLQPKSAGLGAATGAQSMRNLQLQLRFQF